MLNLLDELSSHVLCGDGAMGTRLMNLADVPLGRCLEEFCVLAPDIVTKIHAEYIDAGARVIETNSFGSNAVRLKMHGLENQVFELNHKAAQLARQAADQKTNVYVAGSVGPTGLSKEAIFENKIDQKSIFKEQLNALLEGDIDLIFFETFSSLEELNLALEVARSLAPNTMPIICSMACSEEGRLPSGITIIDAFAQLQSAGASIVGVNCLNGPKATLKLLEHIPLVDQQILSAYPNAGYPRYHDGRYIYDTAPSYFAAAAKSLVAAGARLVGGCCGTTAAQIAAMAKAISELKPVVSKPILRTINPVPFVEPRYPKNVNAREVRLIEPSASFHLGNESELVEETSILDLIAQNKKVIITELDPPKTLELDKFFEGAKALTAAGCDAITLADNSLAILRVSNLAMAAILKQKYGIMPLIHVSCRDRNLLGLQSELLGLSALGIRHILPLTGDPAKVGDHPGAKSVYDVTSIQLINIIQRLNEGFNHIGKSVKKPTNFVAGCTFNPNAKQMDAQLSRLERKLAAGAQYVMTQPIFDVSLAKVVAKSTAQFGVPIFIGVWPLMNGRQAEFLHNEVPGIVIPDSVREYMAGYEGAEGRERGVRLAKDVCSAVLDYFPGVYLITPFLAYETTVALTEFVRAME